jgi:hypothetical protein
VVVDYGHRGHTHLRGHNNLVGELDARVLRSSHRGVLVSPRIQMRMRYLSHRGTEEGLVKAHWPKHVFFYPYVGIWFTLYLRKIFLHVDIKKGANDA